MKNQFVDWKNHKYFHLISLFRKPWTICSTHLRFIWNSFKLFFSCSLPFWFRVIETFCLRFTVAIASPEDRKQNRKSIWLTQCCWRSKEKKWKSKHWCDFSFLFCSHSFIILNNHQIVENWNDFTDQINSSKRVYNMKNNEMLN